MSGCLSHNAAETQGVEATALAHSVHCHATDAYLGTCQTQQMQACSAMSISMLSIRAKGAIKQWAYPGRPWGPRQCDASRWGRLRRVAGG